MSLSFEHGESEGEEERGRTWAHCRRLALRKAKIACWTQTRSKEWLLLSRENMSTAGNGGAVCGETSRASRRIFQRSNTWLSALCSELTLESPPTHTHIYTHLAFSLPGNLTLEKDVPPLPWTRSCHTFFHLNIQVKSPWWPRLESRTSRAKRVTRWKLTCRSLMLEPGWCADFWMGDQGSGLWNCRHVFSSVSVGWQFRVSSN